MYSAESTTAYKDVKRHSTTQKLTVSSTTQSKMTSTQTRGKWRINTEPENLSFASFMMHNPIILHGMLEPSYAYISRTKFSLYFLLAYVQNQKLKKVGGFDSFESYQCFEMYLGIRTMRFSNHCNGLNIATLTRECPGILKSTANGETYTLVWVHEWTLQARKNCNLKEKLALCILISAKPDPSPITYVLSKTTSQCNKGKRNSITVPPFKVSHLKRRNFCWSDDAQEN